MVVLNRVLNVLNEIRGVIILAKLSVIPVRHDYWGSFTHIMSPKMAEIPAITTATTTSSSKISEMPTTENATPIITVSDSTTELFKSIKEYLNSDLSIKSADYVYEFLRKVKDVPRIDRGHVINILTQTHDPIILQKLVNDRCSYILRNWIKEEAKQLPDSNLLLRLLKTVQHLPVDFEVSTSCGLGRVVNNKLVKESSIPGVADMASKLLNRWLQDARQLSESAGNNVHSHIKNSKAKEHHPKDKSATMTTTIAATASSTIINDMKKELNQPVVKGIFEDMFDFSNIGNSSLSSTSSSNIFKPQLSNVFKIKDSTKTTLKSEKFETKQVKLFENKYPDDMEDDMSSLPVGVCHVKDLDRSEGRTAFKRMRKAPSTICKTNSQEANIQESREKQTLEVIYLTVDQGKSIEKLKQKIELKKVLNDTPFANPNSWVYDPNQNASNNVGLGIGVAAGLIPGIGTVNNSIDSNSNNQIMPNYYYHHPNPNIPAPAPVPPPLQLPQPPPPTQIQQQLPVQLPPYQISNASQPNQPPQPSFQFPYFGGNNPNSTVQPNLYPSPQFQLPNNAPSPTQFQLPNNAPSPTQFQLPNNAPSPTQFQLPNNAPSPTQFQLPNNAIQPNQYPVPSNAHPSAQFMGIINGNNNNKQQPAPLPLLNQPLVNDQNQIINRPPTNLTNITTATANNNNNRGGGGRIGPSSSGTGRPTSGKGSECWYYKAGRYIYSEADIRDLEKLKDLTTKKLIKMIDKNNWSEILLLGWNTNNSDLNNTSLRYINKNWSGVRDSEQMKNILSCVDVDLTESLFCDRFFERN
ncbi:5034_t:CDS:2 [Entrophospora sp. SA101]|nr:4305_t:CDS:2 [Entrophospora sp. SA101]CAJ0828543.1 5034_t:CDS:2 [Entrophospora sp. SA101]